jgi:hypothetical protein
MGIAAIKNFTSGALLQGAQHGTVRKAAHVHAVRPNKQLNQCCNTGMSSPLGSSRLGWRSRASRHHAHCMVPARKGGMLSA